jgi:hypothetical protein
MTMDELEKRAAVNAMRSSMGLAIRRNVKVMAGREFVSLEAIDTGPVALSKADWLAICPLIAAHFDDEE